jgi:ketosteroid isomerase-like protein
MAKRASRTPEHDELVVPRERERGPRSRCRIPGRGSGVELDNRTAAVWTLRHGRVTSLRTGVEIDQALKIVGMGE